MLKNNLPLFVVLIFSILNSAYAVQNLRAWHTNGQTFLIWQHSGSVPPDTTYDIYTSSQPIHSIGNAIWIGRVFANNGANFRISGYVSNARWKFPDTLGGTITVNDNEAYFVVTPHFADTAYYAVVLSGDTVVNANNTTGMIIERIESIRCILQYGDSIVTIYAHWIDGRHDYNSGRPDYPVMGNEYCNGLGFNIAVWKRGSSTIDLPLVIGLHGGGSNLIQQGFFRYLLNDGLYATLDDYIPMRGGNNGNTFWTGYSNGFNRFCPVYPSDSAIVVNYTARRVWWEINWLMNNLPVDQNRVSMTGISMGGIGTLLHTQLRPEIFSAGLVYVPILRGLKNLNSPERVYYYFGDSVQNLRTNFDGQPGIYDLLDQQWRLYTVHQDWPYTVIISGKNDTNAIWREKPEGYKKLDSCKVGFALYWDERTHLNWSGAHFQYSQHLNFNYLAKFRKNQSFPAFSDTDLDLITPGRQPNPGNGDSLDGDPWGTWGGYLEWDNSTIVDSTNKWSVTLWVVYQSIYPNDIPDADTILANVTPRKLQQFQPQSGFIYSWDLIKVSTGETLQCGTVEADSLNLITIQGLLLIKEPLRLSIWGPVGVKETRSGNKDILFSQIYPTPFNSSVTIKYFLESPADVRIKIYDVGGRLIKVIIDRHHNPGQYIIEWDGSDDTGNFVISGLYFVKIIADKVSKTHKLIYLPDMR